MDPGTGRFVSVDPYTGDPQAPMSLHRYLYGYCSPVRYTDPSGNFGLLDVSTAIAIAGTLSGMVVPLYNNLFTKYIGTTNKFKLTFGFGAHGAPALYGPYAGAITARIEALRPENGNSNFQEEYTDYAVVLLGLGYGLNIDLNGGSNKFMTNGPRTTKSFAGIGNMITWLEFGAGPISWTMFAFIQLTDGTIVDDCYSLAQGINDIPDLSGFVGMALWIPISK
jgi:hypothetical protein